MNSSSEICDVFYRFMACQGQCTIRNVDAVDQGMWSSLNKTGFAVVLITIFILYSWDQLVSICRCICSARTTVVQVSSYRNAKVLNAVIRVRGIVTYDFQPTKDFQYVLRVIDGAIQVKGLHQKAAVESSHVTMDLPFSRKPNLFKGGFVQWQNKQSQYDTI